MWIKFTKKHKEHTAGAIVNIENDATAQTLIDTEFAEKSADPTEDVVKKHAEEFGIQVKTAAAEAAKETLGQYLKSVKSNGGKRPPLGDFDTHDNALDDPKLGFKSGSEFWHTFAKAQKSDADAKKRLFGDEGYVKKMEARVKATGQSEAIDSEGGIFVLPEFSNELMQTHAQLALLRKYSRVFQMGGTSYSIRARVDKDHTKSVAGGIMVSRKFEGIATTLTKAEFEWVTLKPTKLTGGVAITDEMMEDAPAFATLFPPMFQEALAAQEELDILSGGGTGEPLGAFSANNPSRLTIAAESAQAAGTLNITNVLKMRARCYGYASAVWVCNQDIIPALATMVIGTAPIYLPSAKDDLPDTLLGRPIVWSEYGETLGTQGDIRLFAGSEYALADRGGLNSATSMHVKFLEGEQILKYWRRGDGQPLWRAKLTPVKGSTRSPFIDLATRS